MRIIRHYAYVPFRRLCFSLVSRSVCLLLCANNFYSQKCVCVCVCVWVSVCACGMQIYCVLLPPSCGMSNLLLLQPQHPLFQMLKWAFDFGFAFVRGWLAIVIGGRYWDLGAKVCEYVISIPFSGSIIAIKSTATWLNMIW